MNLKNNEYARQRVLALQLQRGSRRALPTDRARPIAKHRLVVADLLHTRDCHGVSSSDGHSVRAGRSRRTVDASHRSVRRRRARRRLLELERPSEVAQREDRPPRLRGSWAFNALSLPYEKKAVLGGCCMWVHNCRCNISLYIGPQIRDIGIAGLCNTRVV